MYIRIYICNIHMEGNTTRMLTACERTYVHIWARVCVNIYAYVFICMCIDVYSYIYMQDLYGRTHHKETAHTFDLPSDAQAMRVYVCTDFCVCVHIYVCVFVCMCMCVGVCVNIYIYMYSVHATHCNTLQHTATHCNTLQHTATHCNTHIYIYV